jgi:hypothetical protein
MSDHTTHESSQEIPYGYCHCGCGEKTPIARSSNVNRQQVKGEPFRYAQGHGGRRPAQERFWEKVDKRGPDECWLWHGAQIESGYGRFWNGVQHTGAHRFSYSIHHGTIPSDLFICHKCDNPSCVNPNHLFSATHTENMADMHEKGRGSKHITSVGASNPKVKLTEENVLDIRQQHRNGISSRELAVVFNVSESNIARIVSRKSWAHI